MSAERVERLKKYATDLKQRLAGEVPQRHKGEEAGWRQMLEIDLKKTLNEIERIAK